LGDNDGGGPTIAKRSERRAGIDPLERKSVIRFEWRKPELQITHSSDDVPIRVEISGKQSVGAVDSIHPPVRTHCCASGFSKIVE